MTDGAILVTGADGYLGRLLVRHLLATDDRPLLLWVRAGSAAEAGARCAAALGPAAVADPRVRCTGGDLTGPDPFGGVDPRGVGGIVHLAAATSFTVGAEAARLTNVHGTARALDLARRCPRLDGFCLASTLYASGLDAGLIPEAPLAAPAAFANHYESSKWRAERLALDAAADVRVSVVRIATVLADDSSGRPGQFNAVHNTLGLLLHGLLTMVPGEPGTPIHLTTGRQAARALAAALAHGDGVYHLGAADPVLTLGEALDLAVDRFGADATFRDRRTRTPRFIDLETFSMVTRAAAGISGSVLGQAMGSLLPFAPQLFVTKQIAGRRLAALVPNLEKLDLPQLFATTCDAIRSRRDHRAPTAVAV